MDLLGKTNRFGEIQLGAHHQSIIISEKNVARMDLNPATVDRHLSFEETVSLFPPRS